MHRDICSCTLTKEVNMNQVLKVTYLFSTYDFRIDLLLLDRVDTDIHECLLNQPHMSHPSDSGHYHFITEIHNIKEPT